MSIKAIAYLFPQTSRQATPAAPPYDSTRKVKSWVDPSPGVGPTVTYQVVDPTGAVVSLTLSTAEASTLNLPGHPDYPVFAPTKSAATFKSSGLPISFGVALLADAQALVKAFGLTDAAIFDELAAFQAGAAIVWPSDDPRRAWGITFANGDMFEVAALLQQRNQNGVGSPGEWKQDAQGNWGWQSELPSDTPTTAVMPVPIVPLAQNEQIVNGPFGMEILVNDAMPTSADSSFTLATDPTAQKILEGVTALRGLFHV